MAKNKSDLEVGAERATVERRGIVINMPILYLFCRFFCLLLTKLRIRL